MENEDQITELLVDWSKGDRQALDKLIPLVEAELKRIARNYMRRESKNHTLQTTALVNEAFLKLTAQRQANWQNREHFFALSSKIMRRILINYARRHRAGKRRGDAEHVSLDDALMMTNEKSAELLALDEALEHLAEFDKLKSRIVELRYFGGLTIEETAEILGIAPPTVSLHWRLAKAWLGREIRRENHPT
jgi:RNA polymerase sigma-70 factor (ECF subfamily)